jgi:thymidylate synthase ThyX
MSPEHKVYLLDPKNLTPETIAVTFAKTSRSPQSFEEIAAELTEEKSAEFHEKWVVGYGHASVAEHAVLHIAVEKVSRLAVETLESCRLASYTEKSTRYQKWNPSDYHLPEELEGHRLQSLYEETIRDLFKSYQESLAPVQQVIQSENPRKPDESEPVWERRIRSRYVDICRFYLPAAALANVGMTINARALEHTISKMLSHPLAEVRRLGSELKQVGQESVPTLIKYAEPIPYLSKVESVLGERAASLTASGVPADWCQLVDFDHEAENRVLAAALYRYGKFGYAQAMNYVQDLSLSERIQLADEILGGLGSHTIPLRELEYASFTFDILIDQGAYLELKRHRMMTQTPQRLTAHLGYAVPRRILTAGLETHFRTAMEKARQAFLILEEWNPAVASYVVPNAFNRRVLLQFNLRSGEHLIALRSAPNAHFSLRRLAQRMSEEIKTAAPLLGRYLRVNPAETWQQIEREHFAQV